MVAPSFVPFIKNYFKNSFDILFIIFGFLYSFACMYLKETFNKNNNNELTIEDNKENMIINN